MDNAHEILRVLTSHWADITDWAGSNVRKIVTADHPTDSHILDVGAGQGKYRVVLADYPAVDAIEIWEPSVRDNRLRHLYRDVYVGDIYDWTVTDVWGHSTYDVIILGDVMEHLSRERAQETLHRLYDVCDDVIIVVPYSYEQGEEDGNVYQCHLQAGLTLELMAREYPELSLITLQTSDDGSPFKGLYRRRITWQRSDGLDLEG